MNIPIKCRYILSRLENAGFRAYLVGGCVRDMLMGREAADFDITTNALPEQMLDVFSADKVIPTGIKHGTITVLHDGEPFEITTFRIDSGYSDSRRPDSVEFTDDLTADLARRDFTMNAVAMDMNGNICDPFGGREDIKRRLIRCVGDPEKRFTEDALRILRCFRFASVLGFEVDKTAADTALALRERLGFVSVERISAELVKLLGGCNAVDVMLGYRDIIGQIIPELRESFDFDQHSKYHKYTVYEHIVRSVAALRADADEIRILRIAMLLHDVGKPRAFYLDETGRGHFKGHAAVGAEMARAILTRMKFDNRTIDLACSIIACHSDDIFTELDVRYVLRDHDLHFFLTLLEAKKADNSAKHSFVLHENDDFDHFAEYAEKLVREHACLKTGDMMINGIDLLGLGFKGKEIGEILGRLLDMIIRGELENDHDKLLGYARSLRNE